MPLLLMYALSGPSTKLSLEVPSTNFHKLPNLISIFSQIFIYSIAEVVMSIIVLNFKGFE